MKNLQTALFFIFLLGTTIHSSTNAKVLPIIEGAELLDTLDVQNNNKVNLPELSAGIYKNVELEHLFHAIDKYTLQIVMYNGERLLSNLSINTSYDYLLILKPNKKLRFNK